MTLTNTVLRYGPVSRMFHWLTALLILTAIPLGLVANGLSFDTDAELARKALVFSLHKTIGIAAFFVALARILWAVTQKKPAHLHPDRKLETALAETVHWLLYASLVIVPLSGWLHHAATTGFAPIWWPFGQTLPFVRESEAVAKFFAAWHLTFTKVLGLAVLLHIAGALKHALIDRDATLARMVSGVEAGTPSGAHSRAPILFAAMLWGVAIAIGSALGMPSDKTETATLDEVQSEWQVQEGSLEITVVQLNSPVTGSFADWTAAIAFDPDVDDDVKGSVEVTIAIPSLTIGTVTSEAMKPDFFNAEAFPTATFLAAIREDEGGYVAEGTLTVKGQSAPLTMQFTLLIDGETATMEGGITLDRRTFQVGESYSDETSLGFPVEVAVSLTAVRQ